MIFFKKTYMSFPPCRIKFSHNSLLFCFCWIAANDSPWFNIFICTSACTHHGTLANGNARPNKSLCTDPCAVFYIDRPLYLPVMRVADIVACRTEISSLADRCIHSDMYGSSIITIHTISQTCMIVHHQIPGLENLSSGIHYGCGCNLSAEQPELHSFPSRHQTLREWSCQSSPSHHPQQPLSLIPAAIGCLKVHIVHRSTHLPSYIYIISLSS